MSKRFLFLASEHDEYYRLCSDAEKYVNQDYVSTLAKTRIAIDKLVQELQGRGIKLFDGINNLQRKEIADAKITSFLHTCRIKGNTAIHTNTATEEDAKLAVDALASIFIWYVIKVKNKLYPLDRFAPEDLDNVKLYYTSEEIDRIKKIEQEKKELERLENEAALKRAYDAAIAIEAEKMRLEQERLEKVRLQQEKLNQESMIALAEEQKKLTAAALDSLINENKKLQQTEKTNHHRYIYVCIFLFIAILFSIGGVLYYNNKINTTTQAVNQGANGTQPTDDKKNIQENTSKNAAEQANNKDITNNSNNTSKNTGIVSEQPTKDKELIQKNGDNITAEDQKKIYINKQIIDGGQHLKDKEAQDKSIMQGINNNQQRRTVVLHNTLQGEPTTAVLLSKVIPLREINMYRYPNKFSGIIAKLKPNLPASVRNYETHTFPGINKFVVNNQEVDLLIYNGEGIYTVLKQDGKIEKLCIPVSKPIKCEVEQWLCLRNTDGAEGWILFESSTHWRWHKFDGLFHNIFTITAIGATLKEKPDDKSQNIATLESNEEVCEATYNRMDNGISWIQVIRDNGQEGWVNGKYCTAKKGLSY